MKTFENKVAVITGAGSGMGKYLAINLAKAGSSVAICDVNKDTLKETEDILRNYNVPSSSFVLDVSDKQEIDFLAEKVIEKYGRVDLVFNNAGVAAPSSFVEMSEKDWNWCNDINYNAVINSSRAFLPHLLKNEESALINTSSIYGIITTPNNTVYHASKFAVRGFTESLMKEMHDTPVQVHCVYPGHIGTNIVSNARFNEEGEGILGIDGKPAKDREGNLLTASQIGERFREGGMDPDHAAKIILKGVKKDKKRIFVGLDAKLMEIAQRIAPQHYLKIIPFIFFLTLPFYIKRIMRANKARKNLSAK